MFAYRKLNEFLSTISLVVAVVVVVVVVGGGGGGGGGGSTLYGPNSLEL